MFFLFWVVISHTPEKKQVIEKLNNCHQDKDRKNDQTHTHKHGYEDKARRGLMRFHGLSSRLMPSLSFQLERTDNASAARAGTITTDHGKIETPIFMPVGTIGSVKAVAQQQLMTEVRPEIILGNTY